MFNSKKITLATIIFLGLAVFVYGTYLMFFSSQNSKPATVIAPIEKPSMPHASDSITQKDIDEAKKVFNFTRTPMSDRTLKPREPSSIDED